MEFRPHDGVGRDCFVCPRSKKRAGVHRMCMHPEAPEPVGVGFEGKAMAFWEHRPPSWCPLEQPDGE